MNIITQLSRKLGAVHILCLEILDGKRGRAAKER
jgi:hypothetical protein